MEASVNLPYQSHNYNTMSMRAVANEREVVLKHINTEFETMNDQFKNDPNTLDVKTIESLFKELKEINKNLERRKDDATHPRRCFNVGNASTVTWITFGVEILAGVLFCGATVGNYILNNKARDEIAEFEAKYNTTIDSSNLDTMQGLNVAALITTAVAMVILVPLVNGVRQIDNDNDHFEVLMGLSAIKEDGKEFRKFIKQFKIYQNSTDPNSQSDSKEAMRLCVGALDSIPSGELREHIPDRDHWISAMVRLLPENHPIIIQLREMHSAQLQGAGKSEEDGNPSNSSMFQGEKMQKSTFNSNPLLINSGSNKVVSPTPAHSTPRDLLNEHSKRWYALEKTLGFGVDRIQLDGIAFARDGRTANDIVELGARPLFSGAHPEKEESDSNSRNTDDFA